MQHFLDFVLDQSSMAHLGICIPVETAQNPARLPNVGHFPNKVSPNHFVKVLVTRGLGYLPIPKAFRPYMGPVPPKITVKTNTGCQWEMMIKDVNGKAFIEDGWPEFAIAHNLQLGHFLFFKKRTIVEYNVAIFDLSYCEVVKLCPRHPDEMAKAIEIEDDG